jgi:hypothetical protein
MRSSVAAVAVAILSGCAVFSPQRMVSQLDQTNPKYGTPECVQAREKAMAYDDKMAQRIAMGAGAGRAGPIGIAAAMKIDADQHQIREATKAEVAKHCT